LAAVVATIRVNNC